MSYHLMVLRDNVEDVDVEDFTAQSLKVIEYYYWYVMLKLYNIILSLKYSI